MDHPVGKYAENQRAQRRKHQRRPQSKRQRLGMLNPGYGNAYLNRSNARRAVGDKAGAEADMVKFREVSARQ